MKKSIQYKVLSTIILLFIALLSLSFGFFVAKNRTDGNVAYWIFKIIAVSWLVIECITLWLPSSNFGKLFPITFVGVFAQGIPALMRIGWTGENPRVPIALIYVCSILMFIFIVFSLLFSISNKSFKKAENRAKPSSNYKDE